jgi:hypothetical protein
MLSLEQNEWSARTKREQLSEQTRTRVRHILLYAEQDITIARTSLYVISNKKRCQNKWEQLLEQNHIIVETYVSSRTKTNVVSE